MSEKNEKFIVLLDQMQLTDDAAQALLAADGRIEKVTVHRQSRIWEFTLGFKQTLPVTLYQDLSHHLMLAFREIAEVKLNIQADNPQLDEELLQTYWPLVMSDQE